jgi:hypothetical protein
MASPPAVSSRVYTGIFGIALATLMNQILLTRLFSAAFYYHYAFAIVSLTMLGLTIGAMAVFLFSHKFPFASDSDNLGLFSGLYAVSSALAVAVFCSFQSLTALRWEMFMTALLLFLPGFIFSGIVVTHILTRNSRQVSGLYAADLCGAALGCILTMVALDLLGAINAILVAACLSAIVAFSFVRPSAHVWLRRGMAGLALLMTLLTVINITLSALQLPRLQLKHAKGDPRPGNSEQLWNSYSMVTIGATQLMPAWMWGPAQGYKFPNIEQKWMTIDANASTVMTRFNGDLSQIDYLRHEMLNSAYNLRKPQRVTVVGVGGGRDILSALVHGAAHVTGVEMNANLVKALTDTHADFSGNLARNPKIRLVNDEARSYLARTADKTDLIQLSLVDTWAATAAGAFALAENSLYTVDAWRVYLNALSDDGMLSISRWYNSHDHKGELYRMLTMTRAALLASGISNPSDHVVVVANYNIATLIVSKSPVWKSEISNLEAFTSAAGFRIILSPYFSESPMLRELLTSDTPAYSPLEAALDLTPPTDDRPFFFQMVRLQDGIKGIWDAFRSDSPKEAAQNRANLKSVELLLYILMTVTILTFAFIFLPLRYSRRSRSAGPGHSLFLVYFTMIGLGFMFLEIAQMQRLMIFLGHPADALSVVLFSLLVASGLGSFCTCSMPMQRTVPALALLCLVLAVIGGISDPLLQHFRGHATNLRILTALMLILPMGFFMGMCFPLGMKLVSDRHAEPLGSWLWGINGAASVLASILALMLAIAYGITATYWAGAAFYAVATLLMFKILATEPEEPEDEVEADEEAPVRLRGTVTPRL